MSTIKVGPLLEYARELETKIQFLVDSWPEKLEDGGITFPDGYFWPASGHGADE